MEIRIPNDDIVDLGERREVVLLRNKVTDLERRLGEALERVKPAVGVVRPTPCRHFATFRVEDDLPIVRCDECGEVVDPYYVIRRFAHRESNFCYMLEDLKKQATRLAEEVKRLKALKSRLRRETRPKDCACPAYARSIDQHLRGCPAARAQHSGTD